MTDLEKIELAARRNAAAINNSPWLDVKDRQFMSNAFAAFADEIVKIGREQRENRTTRFPDAGHVSQSTT